MSQSQMNLNLFVIALVSATMNYAGFIQVLDHADWWTKGLLVLAAIAVFTSLYMFWSWAFGIIPRLKLPGRRLGGWLTIGSGVLCILAMSAYWNAIALIGPEAMKLSLGNVASQTEIRLSQAINANGTYQSLPARLDALSTSIASLVSAEERGEITGSSGKGGVSNTLLQLKNKVDAVSTSIAKANSSGNALAKRGQACLSKLRSFLSDAGEAANQVDCVNVVIGGLGNQNIAASVASSMGGLTAGVVVPVSVKSAKQKEAVARVLLGIQTEANGIANDASAISAPVIAPIIVERPNLMMAVLIYWSSLIPAIATAIAVDMIPLVVLILKVHHHRDTEQRGEPQSLFTVSELQDAITQIESLQASELKQLTQVSTGVRPLIEHNSDDLHKLENLSSDLPSLDTQFDAGQYWDDQIPDNLYEKESR